MIPFPMKFNNKQLLESEVNMTPIARMLTSKTQGLSGVL